MKRGVLVGIPTLTGDVSIRLVRFFEACRKLSADPASPWNIELTSVTGTSPVAYARNVICGDFLRNTAMDRLWFLDADMEPDERALELLDVEADIVAGRAMIWRERGTIPAGVHISAFEYDAAKAEYNSAYPPASDPVADVDAVGTATMLIERRVLEDRRLRVGDVYEDLHGNMQSVEAEATPDCYAPAIFRTLLKPNGEALRGEDLDFCHRARALGYSIKAHFGIGIGHRKKVDLEHVAELLAIRRRQPAAA